MSDDVSIYYRNVLRSMWVRYQKKYVGVQLESIGLHVDMLWLRKCRENNTGSEEQFKDGYSICDVYCSSISAEGGEKSR